MKEPKKILFPLDLSEASPGIVPWVKTMAEKFGAEIHVLFVARVFEHYSGIGIPYAYTEDFTSQIVKAAEVKMTEFLQVHFHDIKVNSTVVTGYPPEEILEYARAEGVDMIILGTHGRKGLNRIIFGSVAEYVVKHSEVPVLTVNPYKD